MAIRRSSPVAVVLGLFLLVIALSNQPVLAQPFLRQVSTEAIGHGEDVNDSVRPAADATFHLTFALNSDSKGEISTFVNSLTDPSSPNYHKWITPAQFGQKFGAAPTDLNTVVQYLKAQGFTNITEWPDKLFISAQAPRTAVESAFGVNIHGYNRSASEIARGLSATYYAPDQEPKIDQSVAAHLVGVFGLSNAAQAEPTVHKPLAEQAQSQPTGLNPAQLAQVYDISTLHNKSLFGQGETIAIFSPTAFQQSDINKFLSLNDITSSNINIVNVDGGTKNLDDQDEACIDIETTVGQAPDATINVYEGPNNNSFDIFEQVENDDPNVLSESYGSEEDTVSASYAQSYETIREAMAAEGITILVASGDQGAYSSIRPLEIGVSVDASSAYVTAVGGTELNSISNGNWNGEVAWTYNDGTLGPDTGSGGGLSTFYTEPAWQTGPGVSNTNSNGMRQLPDVAALASTPYVNIYADGEYSEFGGTSCSTPLWASSIALIEQSIGVRLGNINPTLYSIGVVDPSAYHDITSGSDGVYSATAGWDFVTGWGSANFALLLSAFDLYNSPTVPTPTISPSGGSFAGSQSVTISDSLSGATIYYTLDGSIPTTNSNQYAGPITVSFSETINAIAAKTSYLNSAAATANFQIGQSVPQPVINPGGGTYLVAQTVTITDSLSGATIYYTTDGTTPTTASKKYTAAITVSASETISAIATAPGESASTVASASFTIGSPVPTPIITPGGGTFASAQTVTIADSFANAAIYYTIDGTAPTANSTLYTMPITVSATETISAIAVQSSYNNSATATAKFIIYSLVPTPTISPNGGTFTSVQTVAITDSLASATIYYTTDGTTPTTSSTLYSGAITVGATETITAIAVVSGYTNSNAATALFTINLPVTASFSSGLQLISLPYTYSGDSLSSIFGYSGVLLAVWSPLSVAYALTPTSPANQIVAGQGYWVRFPQAVSITTAGTPAPTTTPFAITLHAGWNMIGDPFTSSVAVSSLTFNGATYAEASTTPDQLIGPSLLAYNSASNSYVTATSLQPDLGYWIYAYSTVTMYVPAP